MAIDDTVPILETTHLRRRPLRLDIYPSEDQSKASGELYWDDGDSLDSIEAKKYSYYTFSLAKHSLINITAVEAGYTVESVIIDQIRIHGPFKRILGPGFSHTLRWTEAGKAKTVNAVAAANYVTFNGLQLKLNNLKVDEQYQLEYHLAPQ